MFPQSFASKSASHGQEAWQIGPIKGDEDAAYQNLVRVPGRLKKHLSGRVLNWLNINGL
jgi:hypothetical protein